MELLEVVIADEPYLVAAMLAFLDINVQGAGSRIRR
jgi:hypothetical protein